MTELLKSKLLVLLSNASPVTNEEMQSAYVHFTKQVGTVSQSEPDYSEVFRMLNITRVELVFLRSLYRHGQGEKCLVIRLCPKSYPVS